MSCWLWGTYGGLYWRPFKLTPVGFRQTWCASCATCSWAGGGREFTEIAAAVPYDPLPGEIRDTRISASANRAPSATDRTAESLGRDVRRTVPMVAAIAVAVGAAVAGGTAIVVTGAGNDQA